MMPVSSGSDRTGMFATWMTAVRVKWKRGAASTLLGMLLFSMVLPLGVIIHFGIERDRIEREVCVMRNTAPGENTCHGHCYLMRELRKAQERTSSPFENIEVRAYPAEPPADPWTPTVWWSLREIGCDLPQALPAGALRAIEHVPWKG